MAGQVSIKTFKGGMNKDVDVSLLGEDQYSHAENYKLVADEDSNGFIIENSEGNDIWIDANVDLLLSSGYHLVGHCFIKPYLVVFYTTLDYSATPDVGGGGDTKIIRILLDGDEIVNTVTIFSEDAPSNGHLKLSPTFPLNTVGYYEAPDNIKVYWTDGYHPVRVANIMDENLNTYGAGMFDLIPDFPMSSTVVSRPEIQDLVSGNLKVCSVQYAYQYYINKGSETLFSPASSIQVIPININPSYMADTIGGDADDETTYGVRFNINIPSENLYNKIRVVAIQYNSYNAVPQIRIIEELSITPGSLITLSITDTGQLISELTYEEFTVINSPVYRVKDLAVKDNRLFLGNVNEDFFDVDFDARAYRHNGAGNARLFDTDLSSYIDTCYPWPNVPDTHDCINRFNNYDDEDTFAGYRYQGDGITLGAEGPNIKIGIVTANDVLLDTLGSTANDSVSSAGSKLYVSGNKSFQRQEVYRVGIVFRNEKMQPSPVKWCCDFKMLSHWDDSDSYPNTSVSGNTTHSVRMGFNITLGNLPSEAKTWEVVYVTRGSNDRGVLAQGILQPSYEKTGPYYQSTHQLGSESTGTSEVYDPICMFISPEISYNKNLEYKTGDYFQKCGYFAKFAYNQTSNYSTTGWYHWKLFDMTADGAYYDSWYKQDITAAILLPYDTNEDSRYTVGSESVSSYIGIGINTRIGPAGIRLAAEVGSWDSHFVDITGSIYEVVIANYKRSVFSYQYGGPGYDDRQRNVYASISAPKMTNGSIATYEGDTMIDFFWHNHRYIDTTIAEAGGTNTVACSFLFPIETSILTRLNHSPFKYRSQAIVPQVLGQDISGVWTGEIPLGGGTSLTYTQDQPMYLYNSVFSQSPNANLFIADSESFDSNNIYPTRILASEHKINNELLDSFTRFKVNNFLDLDGNKGKIQNLKTFRNQLLFWQDTGFGVASVNRQSLIQDNNPGVLALGTGGILDRYDYISDTIGNQNQYGIVLTRKNIFWFDNNKNEFFKYSNEIKPISKLKGIQTWFNGKGKVGNVNAVYDEKYNDVIFTIDFAIKATVLTCDGDGYITGFSLNDLTGIDVEDNVTCRIASSDVVYRSDRNVSTRMSANNYSFETSLPGEVDREFWVTYDHNDTNRYTLTFNEIVDKFVSFNSFTPMGYIKTDSAYYSSNDMWDIYKHNDDSMTRVTYYGTTYDSVITFSFNENYPYTKVWDALKWVSESIDSDSINQYTDTFQNLEIYNDYQNTGDRVLVVNTTPVVGETELTRRERTWSMSIPRSIVSVYVSDDPDIHNVGNHDETQLFKERMRDKYLTCKFTYDNGDGNIFSVPFISTVYRRSIR